MHPKDSEPGEDAQPHAPGAPVDRRRALQLLLGTSTVGAAAALGVPVVRYLSPLPVAESERSVTLDPDELSPGEGRLVVVGGLPAIVVNTGGGFTALSAVCTHLGCVVKWKKARRQFFCPCHGGRFDIEGRVVGGPAPRPLRRLEVAELPGKIVVRTV
ncbi:MAG: Rieske 2Fe-2S domain-containing protein [Myxococcota bacterium]